jgi:hypothetical protein
MASNDGATMREWLVLALATLLLLLGCHFGGVTFLLGGNISW